MKLLADFGHVESHFSPFGDSANLDARLVHGLRRTYHRLRNHFGRNRWKSEVGHVESRFGPFEDHVSAGARQVHGMCLKYPKLRNHFRCTQW
jgi:hypothetical protein